MLMTFYVVRHTIIKLGLIYFMQTSEMTELLPEVLETSITVGILLMILWMLFREYKFQIRKRDEDTARYEDLLVKISGKEDDYKEVVKELHRVIAKNTEVMARFEKTLEDHELEILKLKKEE